MMQAQRETVAPLAVLVLQDPQVSSSSIPGLPFQSGLEISRCVDGHLVLAKASNH